MYKARLRDSLLIFLGIWLMMAPKVLHMPTGYTGAIWNSWLVGAALILLIAVRRYLLDFRSPWEDLVEVLLGIWLMVSPFFVGFAGYAAARTNSLIVGGLIAVAALIAAFSDAEWRKQRAAGLPHDPLPR